MCSESGYFSIQIISTSTAAKSVAKASYCSIQIFANQFLISKINPAKGEL